jgi:nitrogen-specific signal transduction histidine kinase
MVKDRDVQGDNSWGAEALSKSDIADCIDSFRKGDMKEIFLKGHELADKLDAIRKSLKEKPSPTPEEEASMFFIHEMKNLLAPVVGYAQMVAERIGRKELTSDITEMMEQYLGICHQFVMVFLRDQGMVPKVGGYCIEDMLNRAEQMTKYFKGQNTEVHFDISPERNYVILNYISFFQVSLNIMKNAARAGAKNIYVAEKRISFRGGNAVRIDYSNDGAGLPPGIAGVVFRKGFTTKKDGSGIGLAACKAIVEAAGGVIGIDTESEMTDFYIKLPAVPEKTYPIGLS